MTSIGLGLVLSVGIPATMNRPAAAYQGTSALKLDGVVPMAGVGARASGR
jgi:hypothetical protein